MEERCLAWIDIVKDRDQGIYTGESVQIVGNPRTGRLVEPSTETVKHSAKVLPLKQSSEVAAKTEIKFIEEDF